MGRYSFFIINSAFAGYNVYADTGHSDVLPSVTSSDSDSSSTSSSSDSISLESSDVGSEQERPETTQDYDEIQGPQLTEETVKPFVPWYLDEVLMNGRVETKRFDENDNELPQITPRAAGDVWGTGNFGRVEDTSSGVPLRWINAAFKSWEFGGVLNQAAVNNLLARGVRNSVTATNTRIDNLQILSNNRYSNFTGHQTWASNAIVALRDRATSLEKHETWASNAITDLRSTTDYINGKVNTQRSDFTSHTNWATDAVVSLRERANGIDTKLVNHMSWATEAIEKLRTRATDIDTKLVGHMSWATEAIEKLRTRATDIDTKLVGHMSWATDAVVSLRERANGIDKKIVEHEKWSTEAITGLRSDRDYINEKANKLRSDFNAHQTWATGAITDLRTKDSALQSDINALGTWKNVQLAWNTAQEILIKSNETRSKNNETFINDQKGRRGNRTGIDLDTYLKEGNFYVMGPVNGPIKDSGFVEIVGSDNNVIHQRFTQIYTDNVWVRSYWNGKPSGSQWTAWVKQSSRSEIDALKSKDTELSNSLNSVKSLISTESTERKNADIAINSRLSTIDQEIKTINQKIDGFNWSDVGIIAAIIGIHDAWKSKDYSGPVLNDDGALVKLVKYQRDSIITSFSAVLHNIFGDPADGYLGIFWKHFDSKIYNLRYSIINGFEELKTANKAASDAIRDNQSSMLTHLETVNGWLKLLYQKPNSIIQNPFDFDRLQKMFDGLELGGADGESWWQKLVRELVKELIRGGFELLKTSIETLGSLLETAIKELGRSLGDILDFLDGLLDKIIHLVVPENLDFIDSGFDGIKAKIDVKFGNLLSLGGKIKDVFKPIKKDFFQAISFTFMGQKFEPTSEMTDLFVPKFRVAAQVYLWVLCAIYCYKKLTGQGDLINDN